MTPSHRQTKQAALTCLLLAMAASPSEAFASQASRGPLRTLSQKSFAIRDFVKPEPADDFHTKRAQLFQSDMEPVDAAIESLPRQSTQPAPVLFSAIKNLMDKKEVKASLAAASLVLALALVPSQADAAMSGGRMGGSFSAPRSSTTRMAPAPSYSRGYSQGYRSGYGSGYYSAPRITVSPFVSPFYSPFVPRPYYYGAPGVITYGRGPSFLDLLLIGGVGFMILNAIRSASAGVDSATNWDTMTSSWGETLSSPLGTGTSVAQISVALDVPDRDAPNSILRALDRLASTSKTDSRVGIQNLTSQVALELLRRKSSIVSAASSYKHFSNRDNAQRHFESLSIKERSKFEQETLSRYGGVTYADRHPSSVANGGKATMAVVTLVINIDGDSTKVPTINSISDVEEALRKIASDAKVGDCLQGAEILWTPEDRSETLGMKDVIADYPELTTV